LAGLRKEHRTLARKLPFILAIATLGALIAASSSASSGAKLRAMPLGSNSIVSIDTVAKSASGRLARTSSALLGLKSARPVNVMIKYDFDPTPRRTGAASPVYGRRARGRRASSSP